MEYALVNYLQRVEARIDKARGKLKEKDAKLAQSETAASVSSTDGGEPPRPVCVPAAGSPARFSVDAHHVAVELHGRADVRSRMRTDEHLSRMDLALVRPDGLPRCTALHVELFASYVYLPTFALFNIVIYNQLAPIVGALSCDR